MRFGKKLTALAILVPMLGLLSLFVSFNYAGASSLTRTTSLCHKDEVPYVLRNRAAAGDGREELDVGAGSIRIVQITTTDDSVNPRPFTITVCQKPKPFNMKPVALFIVAMLLMAASGFMVGQAFKMKS